MTEMKKFSNSQNVGRDNVPKYNGKYRGFVVLNLDPLLQGRVQCVVPDVLGPSIATDWAYPIHGEQQGDFAVPTIGSRVWVQFEGGDVNKPQFGGTWYASPLPLAVSNAPAIARADPLGDETTQKGTTSFLNALDVTINEPPEPYNAPVAPLYPFNRVIKLSGGITIELDDTPENNRIKIFHPEGTFIEIHKDGTFNANTNVRKYERINGISDVVVTGVANHTFQGIQNLRVDGAQNWKVTGVSTMTFLASLFVTAAVTISMLIGTVGVVIGTATVTLGIAASAQSLCNLAFLTLYNGHDHPAPGGTTGAPNQQATAGAHSTAQTFAS